MKKITYVCPSMNEPIGGVKVIHKHSELLCDMGVNSEVLYVYGENKVADWFDHKAKVVFESKFNSQRDIVVLPETLTVDLWKKLKSRGIEYLIFVQNGYLVNMNIPPEEIEECYASAKLILCISEDAMRCMAAFFPNISKKLVRLTCAIDQTVFLPSEKKQNIITYMPRKQKKHSDLLVPILQRKLSPGWEVRAIGNMTEAQVAQQLSISKIFLAFSGLEGLSLPPLEAALCGNFVIGYTGQGGNEYWREPVFTEVHSGDLVDFLEKIMVKVRLMDNSDPKVDDEDLAWIKEKFSQSHEIHLLKKMLDVVF
jgi:hypothetical protein